MVLELNMLLTYCDTQNHVGSRQDSTGDEPSIYRHLSQANVNQSDKKNMIWSNSE